MREGLPIRQVTSAQNARVKTLRRALTQGELVEGMCGVDSEHLCRAAARAELKVETLFLSQSRFGRDAALITEFAPAEVVVLPEEIFAGMVSIETPKGVAALVEARLWDTERVLAADKALLIACVGMQDPGNLGTILRSAEAFGASAVIQLAGTVSLYSAKMMRASAGSCFRLPTLTMRSDEALSSLAALGIRRVGADAHRGELASKHDLRGKTAIFIGNEGFGIPMRLASELDDFIRIPHSAEVESLNAGIAASVLLYEAYRQRHAMKAPR